MPDIFDQISATNNGAPSGDIFDRISESKGGEQTNAQNQPQGNSDRNAGREALNEVNASAEAGPQPSEEPTDGNQQVPQRDVYSSQPPAKEQDETLLKGDIFDRVAKGGGSVEESTKANGKRTQEGQEARQGIRSQVPTGNKAEVSQIPEETGVQAAFSKVRDFGVEALSSIGQSIYGSLSGLVRTEPEYIALPSYGTKIKNPRYEENKELVDFFERQKAGAADVEALGAKPLTGIAKTAADVTGGLLMLPAQVFTGPVGFASMIGEAYGSAKDQYYQKAIQEGMSEEDAINKANYNATASTAAALPLYYLSGKVAGIAADKIVSETTPKLVKAATQFGFNAVANTVASAATRGVSAALAGENITDAIKDVNVPGVIQDIAFALHATTTHFQEEAAKGNGKKISRDMPDAVLEELAKDPRYANIVSAEIKRRAESRVAEQAKANDLPITSDTINTILESEKPAEAIAEGETTIPSETEKQIEETGGIPPVEGVSPVGEAEAEVEGGTAPGERKGEEEVTPKGTRLHEAAFQPREGVRFTGESHDEALKKALDAKEITQEYYDQHSGNENAPNRNKPEFGFTTDHIDESGKREFVDRKQGHEISSKAGQLLVDEPTFPHPEGGYYLHSNETMLDAYPRREEEKPEVPFEQLSEGHKLFSDGLDELVKGGALDDARKSVIKKIFRNTDPELLARASDMKAKKTRYLGVVRWTQKYSQSKGKFGKAPEFRLREGLVDFLKEKDPKINKDATATFLHEFGHLADFVFLNDAEKATVKDVYNKLKRPGRRDFFGKGLAADSEFYTKYYASNEAEFFAQSFAEYCLSERVPTEEMRPILERAFDFFKEAIARILKRATTNEAKLLKPIFERIVSGKMEPKELESSFIPKKGDLKTQKEMMKGGFVSPEKVTATPSRDPLEELSEKIKKSSTAKPPKNAFDAAKQAQKIVEEVKGAKDAVTKGIAKAGAGFQAMKNSYLNRPVWTDFKQALGEWSRADNYTSLKVREAVKDLKKSIPDPLKREAITNWIQAGGDEALLRERASKSDSKYRKGYEAALKLTDEEKAHAKNISKYLEDMLQEGIDSGMLNHGIENYITQVWKKENPITQKLQASLQGGKLNKNFQFAKKRVFDSYFEGEQAGYEPASKDVASLIAAYDLSFRKTEAVRAFVKSMTEGKAQDGRPLVELSGYAQPVGEEGKPPDSYLIKPQARPEGAVTEDGRSYVSINHPAFKGWKWTMKGPDGKPVLMESDMLVHPDIATDIKNLTSKSWFKANRIPVVSSAVEGLLKFSSILKQTKLSLSLFHLDQEGLHSLFHRINPANLEKIDLNDQKQNELVLHGLQLADFHSQELFSEGLAGGGLVGKIPVIGKAQNWFNDFLFKDYIPKLKMNMATHALERNMARYGKQLTEDQIYELTANQANAAFGELNYKMMARNQTVQDTMRLFLLAPDFLEARSRFVAQALKPYGAEQRAALALMGASLYVAGRVLNQALDGDPHYDKPFSIFHEGREYRLRTVLGDVSELAEKPNTFFMNRLSPFGRTGVEFLTGRNAQGIKRSAVEQAEDFLSWFVPIPAQVQPSSTTASTILSSIGLSNYQHMAQTDAYDLANKWLKNQTSPKIQAQVKKREEATLAESDYKQLKAALLAGNMDFAKKEYNRLVKEKGKTYLDFSRSFNVNKPFTGSFENEVKFYKSLNSNQKAQYKKAIEERKVIAQRLRKTITK